jgi:hypothetical protein
VSAGCVRNDPCAVDGRRDYGTSAGLMSCPDDESIILSIPVSLFPPETFLRPDD